MKTALFSLLSCLHVGKAARAMSGAILSLIIEINRHAIPHTRASTCKRYGSTCTRTHETGTMHTYTNRLCNHAERGWTT